MSSSMKVKSVAVELECGCVHRLGSSLDMKRVKLCQAHKLERLHIGPDDVSLFEE